MCTYFKNNQQILDFAKECSKIPYSKEFEYIFKIYPFKLTGNDIQKTLDTIYQLDLEINFKTKIIISCLRFPYQYSKYCGDIYIAHILCAHLTKTQGFNPINGNHYYSYYEVYNSTSPNIIEIDNIIINGI